MPRCLTRGSAPAPPRVGRLGVAQSERVPGARHRGVKSAYSPAGARGSLGGWRLGLLRGWRFSVFRVGVCARSVADAAALELAGAQLRLGLRMGARLGLAWALTLDWRMGAYTG